MISIRSTLILLLGILFCASLACAPPSEKDHEKEVQDKKSKFVQLSQAEAHMKHKAEDDYLLLCSFCHGDQGRGDGMNAFSISIRPRNFTDQEKMKDKNADMLASVIRDGGKKAGLSPDMPPWGRTLTEDRINSLADYILSMKKAAETEKGKDKDG